ncbi:MAG: ABC transporter permease subunit [Clostridium sp.]|uniref:ABC transporter permease subunit n=1 Tax=Clostridium sp. TaxID=1506 RepID=UPI003028DA70
MSKVCGLIKNELIKQYKKTSIKVIIILIIIATIVLPVALKVMNNRDHGNWQLENYKNQIQWQQTEAKNIDDSKKNSDIQKQFFEESIKNLQVSIDSNISWEDWRGEVVNQASSKKKEAILLSGLLNGLSKEELFYNIRDIDIESFNHYYDMTKEDVTKEMDKKLKESNELYATVEKNDYLGYIEKSIKFSNEEIKQAKENIKLLEEQFSKDKENKKISDSLEDAKLQLLVMEERLEATKYRYDNKIPYDAKNWKNKTIKDIAYNIDRKGEKLLNEDMFKQQYNYQISKGLTYDEYKANFETSKKTIEETIALDWYSLENNMPQVNFSDDARNSIDSTYLIYVNIAIILCIIVGGGIVSSEYSTGTVRLLMIRPVSRTKILFSKLVTIFMLGYGVLIATFILNVIISGVVYGFGTLGTPIISFVNGAIVEKSYIISIIPKLLFSSISLIFIIAVVFTISTVIKNTALAVGLTTVGFLGSSAALMVMAQLNMKWVGKTIIPYVDLTKFVSGNYMVDMLTKEYGIALNSTMGAVQLLLIAAILIVVSFLVFTKRDVTN